VIYKEDNTGFKSAIFRAKIDRQPILFSRGTAACRTLALAINARASDRHHYRNELRNEKPKMSVLWKTIVNNKTKNQKINYIRCELWF
jgi:hypothetical protein